jgi:membrane protein
LAQALAFNALFAIFPLAILALATLATVYGGVAGQGNALALIGTLAPAVQGVLADNLQHVVRFRGVSGALALVALLWSGKNLFQAVAYALDRSLRVRSGRPIVTDILVAIVMLPVLGTLLVAATAVPPAITFVVHQGGFPHAALWTQIAGYGTALLLVFIIALLLYDYLPSRRVPFGFGLPGAIFTTIAYGVAQIAFAVYSTHVDFVHVYGALATFAVLLLWFYYMAVIFLFGAQLSAEWLASSIAARSKSASEALRSA